MMMDKRLKWRKRRWKTKNGMMKIHHLNRDKIRRIRRMLKEMKKTTRRIAIKT
jgi:hypothetical protein